MLFIGILNFERQLDIIAFGSSVSEYPINAEKLFPKTVIPGIRYEIQRGKQTLITDFMEVCR